MRPVLVVGAMFVLACRATPPTAPPSAALPAPPAAPSSDATAPPPSSTVPTQPLIQNVYGRASKSLDGSWRAIVDPYENGYYDYRLEPAADGYFLNRKPTSKTDRIEYDFDRSGLLAVPGDWNSQRRELFFYEGTVWYERDFDPARAPGRRLFIYFGAANYRARVYVNGRLACEHVGGFTPFDCEITGVVRDRDNFVVVEVNDDRRRDGVPTVNTDWWNYGGLTREAMLVDVPQTFVRDYQVGLARDRPGRISAWVELDGARPEQDVAVRIAEAGVTIRGRTDAHGLARLEGDARVALWSPEAPTLYRVEVLAETDRVEDRIGFRTVETRGADILLNKKPLFLRGVSIHEQAPMREGRAFSEEDARTLLGWARELGANFVRLAHYPHNEHMTRLADEMGILVWEEIPVYWTIAWENQATLANAKNQLTEMIGRDKNRASTIVWSVGNETPESPARLRFLAELVGTARALDPSRLVSAALEKHEVDEHTESIDDPLGGLLDVLGCNEYIGWYDGLPEKADSVRWTTRYEKPLVITEFGADALQGLRGDGLTRWSEDYQANVYEHQLRMLERIPFLRGMTPWILADFRSPRRTLPGIQDYWNRKGLISDRGEKKQAFYVLQRYYERLARAAPTPGEDSRAHD